MPLIDRIESRSKRILLGSSMGVLLLGMELLRSTRNWPHIAAILLYINAIRYIVDWDPLSPKQKVFWLAYLLPLIVIEFIYNSELIVVSIGIAAYWLGAAYRVRQEFANKPPLTTERAQTNIH